MERAPATAARKPGGYYLDDGPLPNAPAELDKVPDAQPRPEPIKASTTRPYTVMGKTYVPMASLQPYAETGVASWYGKRYHGQPTASGEVYDMFAMTAAHPVLPIPSYARVTSLDTERTVIVKINDRGPFHADRLIDLSYTAAYRLGIVNNGSARVRVESIIPGGAETARTAAGSAAATTSPSISQPVPGDAAAAASGTAVATGGGGNSIAASKPTDRQAPGIYLQLGSFSLEENAQLFLRKLRAEVQELYANTAIYAGESRFRVQAGPYATREQALEAAARIQKLLDLKPVLATRAIP